MRAIECEEPYDGRLSRTVPGEAGGVTPPAYSIKTGHHRPVPHYFVLSSYCTGVKEKTRDEREAVAMSPRRRASLTSSSL